MKKILLLIIFPALVILFNFLEYGLIWDSPKKFIYPILLGVATILNFYKPNLRHYFLIFLVTLFILMVVFYLANQTVISNAVGSFGFALLITLIISYLPVILKKGYIEKL